MNIKQQPEVSHSYGMNQTAFSILLFGSIQSLSSWIGIAHFSNSYLPNADETFQWAHARQVKRKITALMPSDAYMRR